MKILLISANTLRVPFPVYPIALDYLAGALGKAHDVRFLDLIDKDAETALKDAITSFDPECIGLSIRNVDNSDAVNCLGFVEQYRKIASIIKSQSAVPLVLGGAGYTIFPERLLKELGADYGIVGEGERFPALIEALEQGRKPDGLPGVVMPGVKPSKILPWDKEIKRSIPTVNTLTSFYVNTGGMLNLQTKRGCPFKCIYCTYPVIEGCRIRYADPVEVALTAAALKASGAKYLYISDSVFNSDEKHCLDIASELIKTGNDIPLGAFFSPLKPTAGFYENLKQAGFTHVEFGTEALSDAMLDRYHKPFNVNDVFDAHNAAIDAGLHVAHYFMLGGPGETSETVEQTLDNAEKLKKAALFFFCGVRIYPGTGLYKIALEERKVGADTDLLEPVFYQSNVISSEDIEKMVEHQSNGRRNWVLGAGSEDMNRVMARLYSRGRTGPLWEKLI